MSTQSTELPVHPVTGLPALGVLPSGRIVWPVLGGSGDDQPPTTNRPDHQPDPVDEGQDDDGQDDDVDDEPLGPAGQKALAAEKAKRREQSAKRRAAEARAADLEAELDQLRNGAKTGEEGQDQVDVDKIRREAEKSALTTANARILRSEVKAAAAGKLADPADALRFLDLTQFEVGADGEIDEDELRDAVDELLTRKPYLAAAASGAPRFQGSADQGPRPKTKTPTLDEQITAAEKAGDWATARRLKTAKLTQTTTHQQ
ncbi:hypothetical protein [Actinomadura gamaensis]|uniref:Scaffolding protein n=1 Tax=Actinomadura gamaensis TaxID=1763541 RepID=A0ABV9U9S3_9ACTN